MKNARLAHIVLVLLLPAMAKAQLQKGNLLLSASLRYNHSTIDMPQGNGPGLMLSRDIRSYSITPQVGKLVKPTFLLGVQASAGQNWYDFTDQYGTSLTTQHTSGGFFAIGLLAQKYFEIGGRFYLYLGSSLGYSRGNTKYSSTTFDQSNNATNTYNTSYGSNELNVSLYPGITYFITRSFALEMAFGGLGYSHSIMENDSVNTTKSNSFYFNFDWLANGLSLQYYLNRQKATQ